MIERTLAMVKPDGVMMRLLDKIRQRYLDEGLRVVEEKVVNFTYNSARLFYYEHDGRPHFAGLCLFMSSGPCVAFQIEGENAISRVRQINGATDPDKATPGTIRHDFRSAGGPANVVHASDSPEAAAREIALIFERCII